MNLLWDFVHRKQKEEVYWTEVSISNCIPYVHMYCLDSEVEKQKEKIKKKARQILSKAMPKINDNQISMEIRLKHPSWFVL